MEILWGGAIGVGWPGVGRLSGYRIVQVTRLSELANERLWKKFSGARLCFCLQSPEKPLYIDQTMAVLE
jgi:hypothetical protein